jgi:peptide/nickel transport system substrate-binding protein
MSRQPALTRRGFLRTAGLAVGGGLAACRWSAAPARAQAAAPPLRVALPAEPSFMNPILVASDRNFAKVSWQVFDSLLAYDYGARRLAPQLATSWRQVNPTTWEFKLREGVQFHRGYGELTAADVEFMVNYVVDSNKPLKFLYFFVKGAKATGKYTVQYSLTQPFAPFLVTTVRDRAGMIVSKKAYQEMGEEAFSRNPVGTGPFELSGWKEGAEIALRRFSRYWQQPGPMCAGRIKSCRQLHQIAVNPLFQSYRQN